MFWSFQNILQVLGSILVKILWLVLFIIRLVFVIYG
jgi:hypothetical protein